MSKKRQKEVVRPLIPVPEYVSDPDKLAYLGVLMGLDTDTLLAVVEQDYDRQGLAHPAIYEATGPEKGGLLIHILQQCKSLAEGFEKEQGGNTHLSRTLQHVQAHLAVLVADYEEQLRTERRSPK